MELKDKVWAEDPFVSLLYIVAMESMGMDESAEEER